MSTGTGRFSWRALRGRLTAATAKPSLWRPAWSPAAARRAVRATIVMPGLFALTLQVFGNLQMALFAAFGSFATLVLISFAGSARNKLLAHLVLAVSGSVLLVIGTAVSGTTVLAALVTVPVTFCAFFAGVAGPNAASGVTGALLAYVLPAASPGGVSTIPDRLAGWWLASVVGTIAVLLLPAPAGAEKLRTSMRELAGKLADVLQAALRGEQTQKLLGSAIEAKHGLMDAFNAGPFRPTGLAVRDQALADGVERLEWCTTLVGDALRERPELLRAGEQARDLLGASAAALRDIGALFADASITPDLEGLDARRRDSFALDRSAWQQPPESEEEVRISFHAQAIGSAVLAVGAAAVLAATRADPQQVQAARTRWFDGELLGGTGRFEVLERYSGIAARHASLRSVWFINSLRGALALAAAVGVANASSVQHGFWVVLGTLSVLRTNASATGATALRALLGTLIGFVVGGALLIAIGASTTALWVVLPFAVTIAAYAQGTMPFVVGQAAFTVTVAVLFNLLEPVGWKVGELRVEDVAIGCGVSVLVGALFWPRGVAPLVADDLADAYRAGGAYLLEAIDWVLGRRTEAPAARSAALTADSRLDESVRGYLAQQGTKQVERGELWRLIGGTLRLRLTAQVVTRLPEACAGNDPDGLGPIRARTEALVGWYEQLALQVGRPTHASWKLLEQEIEPLVKVDLDRSATAERGRTRSAVWLGELLEHLIEHLEDLVAPAMHVAASRRRPWWR